MKTEYICKFKGGKRISEETLSLNEDNPEEQYKEMLDDFNEIEKERYGDKVEQRIFVSIKLKTKQNIYCEYEKKYMAMMDGKRTYDLYVCKRCKKRHRNYGISISIKKICKGENYYEKSYKN